jgi:hypothetical protein
MTYTFKGILCGLICSECPEPLSNVKVRLYSSRNEETVVANAVANPKDTFAILTSDAVKSKAASLIAEVDTDADGNFVFQLGDKQKYGGEAFEVDVYCATVPHRKPGRKQPEPLQFSITTLQPMWRESGQGVVAAWNYCIPARLWCLVRARMGAWVICGEVLICSTKTPVAGVKVRAFDVDWLQDDDLGSAITDGSGKFRIDYLADDFKTTIFSPLINLEWVGGPDLYFKIEDGGGTVLLAEPSSRGRKPDRENAGPCFCVDLCLENGIVPPFENPWFTHVGDFDIIADIDSLSGLTNKSVIGHGGPKYGFMGSIKLKGFCPKTAPSGAPDPMQYRFMYELSTAPGIQKPVTGSALLTPVAVGSRLKWWDVYGTGATWTPQTIYIAGAVTDVVGGTTDPTPVPVVPPGTPWGAPPPHVIVPDSDGWVSVDQTALDNGFYGPLMRLNSAAVVSGGGAPGNGAGVAVAVPKNGIAIAIIFQARRAGQPAPFPFSNALSKMLVNNWAEVNQLNLQQFLGAGSGPCSGLSTDLDILYTIDHELMAAWSIDITSAAAIPAHPPYPSGTTPRGGFGSHHVNIAAWPKCSYAVWLYSRPALTDGETDRGTTPSLVTFCK